VARAVNPITGGNWEGSGVQPDVQVPAADALEVALRAALEKSCEGELSGPRILYDGRDL
jgi:hypothetical protein